MGSIPTCIHQNKYSRVVAVWSARKAHNLKVTGSNPVSAPSKKNADVAHLDRAVPCHGIGSEFKSRHRRHKIVIIYIQTNYLAND